MGANASTAVPTYVSGEVLDAARLNLTNCGVPVFSGTATRDASFGGSGEKTLAEGQLCYLEDSNVVQYYDGSSFATVGPSSSSGLVCVKAETTFTAVTSFTFDSVFSSTYTNYLIKIIYTTSTTSSILVKMRVGGVSASTNYNQNRIFGQSATVGSEQATAQTSGLLLIHSASGQGAANINMFQPFVVAKTVMIAEDSASDATFNDKINVTHTTAASHDGMEFAVASGTMTGSYAIYGYSKTV